MRIGARGHTVPNLIRQRKRLMAIIRRNGIVIRAQAAVIVSLKGLREMRCAGENLTSEEVLLRSVREMKQEAEAIQRELVERDVAIADAQARLKDLSVELARHDATLVRKPTP